MLVIFLDHRLLFLKGQLREGKGDICLSSCSVLLIEFVKQFR